MESKPLDNDMESKPLDTHMESKPLDTHMEGELKLDYRTATPQTRVMVSLAINLEIRIMSSCVKGSSGQSACGTTSVTKQVTGGKVGQAEQGFSISLLIFLTGHLSLACGGRRRIRSETSRLIGLDPWRPRQDG
ncbi:hypothetical protein RRG08_052058 [Elysia crispata]|uniref:Uncharacterized protein n=1 Tax=Elysia crispata TaxID=231223 RepID=A0AAE1DS12_9GAST|nr:hypothetical protein RRG08_052058 [Elysia crispata]